MIHGEGERAHCRVEYLVRSASSATSGALRETALCAQRGRAPRYRRRRRPEAGEGCSTPGLEILEDRYGVGATIITSQLDPKNWHAVIGDETVADAICDRLVHGAHRIKLAGESLRKGLTNGTKPAK